MVKMKKTWSAAAGIVITAGLLAFSGCSGMADSPNADVSRAVKEAGGIGGVISDPDASPYVSYMVPTVTAVDLAYPDFDANDGSGDDDSESSIKTHKDAVENHYIGEGYNYFGDYASESGLSNTEILSSNKMFDNKMIADSISKEETSLCFTGKTVTEMENHYKESIGSGVDVGAFSSSFKLHSNFDATSKLTVAVSQYNHVIQVYQEHLKKQYYAFTGYTSDGKVKDPEYDTDKLRNVMNDDVKTALDGIKSEAEAKTFMTKYGTHVITYAVQGGRYEISAYTENSEVTSATEFGTTLTAKYEKVFNATGSYDTSSKMAKLVEQSVTTSHTLGGSSAVNNLAGAKGNTDKTQASDDQKTAAVKTWAESVSKDNCVLCSFGPSVSLGGTPALLPVWYLTTDTTIQGYLKAAFTEMANDAEVDHAYKNYYIKDIHFLTGSDRPDQKIFSDDHELYYRLGNNLKHGSMGALPDGSLYYSITIDPKKAMTDLNVAYTTDYKNPSGYICYCYGKDDTEGSLVTYRHVGDSGKTPITALCLFSAKDDKGEQSESGSPFKSKGAEDFTANWDSTGDFQMIVWGHSWFFRKIYGFDVSLGGNWVYLGYSTKTNAF